ncbi:hypothetical protein F4553_002299 [Allocatelliglobosispora scoriae]|uniref:Uncharacterized protein n=1 Tax=Allocatelliglobosispora scoriae TaxID=643052 RepID=A0A841BQ18_9ACTN|nr:hypothetical protein [Allocatelliglobosispora scoriae]MBB5868920.1 hypothetical protein [Allocatelliglobosispora scoriae]
MSTTRRHFQRGAAQAFARFGAGPPARFVAAGLRACHALQQSVASHAKMATRCCKT